MRAHQLISKVRFVFAFVIALSLFVGGLPSFGSVSATLSGDSARSVAREPQLQPDQLGNGVIDGLQYANPTEGLALVSPPVANSGGGAQIEYPFVIPPGRGITPDVSLGYDSGGENSWVGLGWDLSVGEISVDTTFGAPHFDPALESESYLLNGDLLTPNATSGVWTARVSERQDYTRQVETEYQQIIRHGNSPKNYFWEVRDKFGNIFWYGGRPDPGGPFGGRKFADIPNGTAAAIDTGAIVFDDNDNAVKWYLSAQRDVGVNQIRYYYTPVTYVRTTSGWSPQACVANVMCGRHLYLDHIDYTEAAEVAPDPGWVNDAPYRIEFQRESEVTPSATVRPDPIVDGSLGFVDVINDRLARVVVMYGDPKTDEPRSPRDYNQVAVRYDLEYEVGPFGKSLLSRVGQISTTSTESAWHEFDYSDPLVHTPTGYAGFAGPTDWFTAAGTGAGGDISDQSLLSIGSAAVGALGASVNNSAEGHAYIGFNAAIPQKVGSFGGSFQIGGGGTEALAEWIDLNGDTLPDKVWKDGSTINFRLNQSGPDGGNTFGPATPTGGSLPRLSRDSNISFQLSAEAHLVVTLAVGIGGDFSIGDSYFTDVNADGLVDFVTSGSVYFNTLVSGVPTFNNTGSTGTLVPLPGVGDGGTPAVSVDEVAELQQNLEAQSPPIDTVKRWIAPYGGTISITAPATMTGVDSNDGVRVAIQHNDSELASANLLVNASSAPLTIAPFNVSAGDEIFFRVGSINDGANDEVSWDPTITYTAVTGVGDLATVPLDANGLSQLVFDSSSDFTLAGRPNSAVVMPKSGVVRFQATVSKPAAISDDMRLVLKHNGIEVPLSGATIARTATGTFTFSVDVTVAGPVFPTEANPSVTPSQDTMEAYLAVDSPIDLTQVTFDASAHYIGEPTIVVDFLPEIEQYPHQYPRTVATTVSANGTYDVQAIVNRSASADSSTVIMTVKTAAGVLVDRASQSVGSGTSNVTFDSSTAFGGGSYFIEFMLRNDNEADTTTLGAVTLHPDGAHDHGNDITNVAATLRWRGPQGVFPLAYRGWGVAGYTAPGTKATTAITRSAFVVQPADFDVANAPTGFTDINTSDPGSNVEPSYAFIPDRSVITAPGVSALAGAQWRGPRQNHAANATHMRTSRLGADSVALSSGPGVASGSGTAVTRIGIAAPSASLAIGIGPLGGSVGIGPSFGLVDYEDMNGDGYPDVLTPGKIHYTNQRGGYLTTSTSVSDLAVLNQDLTISASGGLSVQLVDIKGNSKGKTNATQGAAAAKGGAANDSSGGMGIGGNVSASWTSPNASGGSDPLLDSYAGDLADVPDASTGGTADIQVALADVNGDGLSDRVFTTPQGVFAQYNLGYKFTSQSVRLTTGGFQSQESYAGTASLGFSTPWAEFSGGFALNWNYDQSRYTWRDVNGDGILDQVKKVDGGMPLVAFGTGSGVLAPVEYGEVASSDATLVPAGQQVSFDQANGAGGGFDFTVYIGPLCLVACYLVINPGFSYQYSVSTTRIDMQDVNGDGFADSVSTGNDDKLSVRLNLQSTTNLLATVRNPIGGSFTMEYGRDGNTVDHPDSTWTMESVSIDDGRTGDGANVQKVEYDYAGLKYDRVHRQSLGFATITAREMDVVSNLALRTTTTEYFNDSVFTAGLQKSVTIKTPGGRTLHNAETTWKFRDVRNPGAAFDVLARVTPVDVSLLGATNTVASRGRSVAPMVTDSKEYWYESGNEIKTSTTSYTYDGLGNMLTQLDEGEPTDPNDNVLVTTDYADCLSAASSDLGCMNAVDPPNVNTSPIFSNNLCPTWVSLPVEVTVTNGLIGAARKVYRHRDGRGDVCDNASMTHNEETRNAAGDIGATELTYDEWGSYDRIVYPAGPDEMRYAVHYEWDDDGHGKIAQVTEYDLYDIRGNSCDLETYIANAEDADASNDVPTPGDVCDALDIFMVDDPLSLDDLTRFTPATSYPPFDLGGTAKGTMSIATFDPLNGRVASRTDANGNTINYTYDSLARIKTISSPRPEDTVPLVSFTYQPLAAGYAYASASHLDIFRPGDTIDTFTFVDGIGRTTQTKRDARLFQGAGVAPVVGRSVSSAVDYDALGRVTNEYLPTQDNVAAATFKTLRGALASGTAFDLNDRVTTVTKPGTPSNRVTAFVYAAAARDAGGPSYFTTQITEPNLRATTNFFDVRGATMAVDDKPAAFTVEQTLRTRFNYDGMGQMLTATDRAGKVTTHEYDMAGNRIATTTPDGGRVTWGYDAQGKLIAEQTPNLRALGTSIGYDYDFGKLVSIDYPGSTPDVSYTYGETGDPHNGAGRVIREEDGARIVTMEYSESGAMTSQLAEMKYHDWFNSTDKSQFQTTMEWTYDGLGRIVTVTYPDTEILTYDYDEGGLAQTVNGSEAGFIRVQIGIDPITLQPIYVNQPHTWTYEYLRDRQYDEMLRVRWQEVGNGARTELTFDAQTLWLKRQQSFSPGQGGPAPDSEIQDLNYTYDSVGNPTEYRNNLPPAVPSLMGGSSVHRYRYDPLERIIGGTGIYELSGNRHERYELSLTYDSNGNVTAKDQYDAVVRTPYDPVTPPGPVDRSRRSTDLVNTKNTFAFTRTYKTAQPHQAIAAAGESYSYDLNGNMLGLRDSRGRFIRQIQWDANDRMTLVTDGPSSTEYRYDDSGNRAIERGPAGETAFVNPWATTRNKNELFKHIWVDNDRIATQRDDGPYEELKRYFLHKDLQGSTNVVTDATGKVFQHHEYFPNGDAWIDEKSTQFRTPYQFAGAYIDESRDIANMGARWYDQNRELFYAPDPALSSDPTALLRKPAMAAAYAYAGSNPIGNIDPSGLEFFTVQNRAAVVAAHADSRAFVSRNPAVARSIVDAHQTSLPRGLVKLGVNIEQADRVQKFSEKLEANPLVEIDLDAGTVKLGAPYGKRIRIPRNTTASPAAQGAANANGGPANGPANNPAPNANAVQPTAVNQAVNPPPQVNNAPPKADNSQAAVQRPPRVRQRANSAPANLVSGTRADE